MGTDDNLTPDPGPRVEWSEPILVPMTKNCYSRLSESLPTITSFSDDNFRDPSTGDPSPNRVLWGYEGTKIIFYPSRNT